LPVFSNFRCRKMGRRNSQNRPDAGPIRNLRLGLPPSDFN
jgi:hypothetical protein